MSDEISMYKEYLKLEKGYSDKTIESYLEDIKKFYKYAEKRGFNPLKVFLHHHQIKLLDI